MEKTIRLNKYLKDIGICSRRKADEFIEKGYIKVNGEVINALGYKVDPEHDIIEVLPIVDNIISQYHYILLNKPKGYVCSKSDMDGKNIFEILPTNIDNLSYAGRLDKDSQGLVLLSNNGQFVYSVTGKEHECEKEYIVTVNKPLTNEYLFQQASGNIRLDGKAVRKAKVNAIDNKTYSIILTEGMNRQIRRMAENQGYKVIELKRIRIGNLTDKNLSLGSFRELTHEEVKSLYPLAPDVAK
ncbi:MAG: rRNA pseudouridine synthase [Proteobacteria bacterium]|jgi:23S rRNA pseudouridine2604 synthase|nr:rRNA pseudouridine synthase [Pseudomonadota bacterium]